MTQLVKHLLAMQETQVQSLGREDPLEKEMAPHSSTLAWKIPWTEEPGRLQSMGLLRVGRHTISFTPINNTMQHNLYHTHLIDKRGSLVAQMVKNLPAKRKT